MSAALMFPGQGSQSVGMGKELADQFPEAKAVFDEVDEALGEKLSTTIWDGPEEKLTLTANAQPALMAVSMATIRVMQSRGFDMAKTVSYVAGHSLGEYSALCSAGAFSIADTAKLLRTRGRAMQDAVPVGQGAMAAVMGLEPAELEAICETASDGSETVGIANDNGGGQLVISGTKDAVQTASSRAKDAGAKRVVDLPVSAPFHSSLMAPAAAAMTDALGRAEIKAPVVPVLSNVEVAPLTDPEAIRRALIEQVTGRVRWRETIEWFAAHDVDTLYEIGAGKVLCGLARRIDRSLATFNVSSAEDIERASHALV